MSSNKEFPFENLPHEFKDLILVIFRITKAPLAMICSSILGAISLVCQRQIDVQRPGGLEGPVSLFMFTIAESGERKSTVDRMVMRSLFEMDEQYAQAYRIAYDIFEEDMELFTVQKQALISRLKSETKLELNTDNTRKMLKAFEQTKPLKPARKRLLLNDATPAALKQLLAEENASTGLMSDEAGIVFGSRALEQLPMLNKIWDGSTFTIDRANAPELPIKNARMTMLLMAQPGVVEKFLHRGKDEARDTGFLARCLMCYPETTQGTRFIEHVEIPSEQLHDFHKKLAHIASLPADSSRKVMHFNREASLCWQNFYNNIESSIGQTGYNSLAEFKDYASKMPENVARLAALIEYFHTGRMVISLPAVNNAIEIIEWYGCHYINLIGRRDNLHDDAGFLYNWLREFCHKNGTNMIPCNLLLRYCPNRFRSRDKLNAFLEILQSRNLVRITYNGKSKFVMVNDWMNKIVG